MNKAKGTKKGIVDTGYLLHQGKTRWIEFKLPGQPQKKEQKQFEKLCILLGHEYIIVETPDEFRAATAD